jgi:hypothetical protein
VLKFSLRTCEFVTIKRVHQLGACFQLFLNPLVRIQQVGVSRILRQILILVDNFVSYGRNIWKHARAVVLITFLHFNHLLLLVSAFMVHLFVVLKLIILIIVLQTRDITRLVKLVHVLLSEVFLILLDLQRLIDRWKFLIIAHLLV